MLLDTLLDLHAKLATVVRYYDRMLEERLSKTYGQLSLGAYRTNAPRTSSTLYPSIPAEPLGGQYGAEDYYGVQVPLQSSTEYQPGTISNYPPSSSTAQFQYNRVHSSSTPGYSAMSPRSHQRSYPNEYTLQRAPSFQGYHQSPIETPGATYYSNDRHESYHQQQDQTIQSQTIAASSSHAHPPNETNSQDQPANYYLNGPNYAVPTPQLVPHPAAPSFNPSIVSPVQQNQPQSPTPDTATFQTVQQSRTQQLAQQGFWPQHSPSQHHLQQEANPSRQLVAKPNVQPNVQPSLQPNVQPNLQPNLAYPTINSYPQDLFPSAPQHQPQPKVVEESLIEL